MPLGRGEAAGRVEQVGDLGLLNGCARSEVVGYERTQFRDLGEGGRNEQNKYK
jgi:hypothetical protein